MQRDPEPGKTDLPISSVNSYISVGNNPANNIDPTGRNFFDDIGKFIKGFIVGGPLGILGQISIGVASAVGAVSERFIDMALVTIAVAGAAAVTGGAAGGAVGGGFFGGLTGSLAGGLTGGLVGGTGFEIFELGTFAEGFKFGFELGAAIGGFAGAYNITDTTIFDPSSLLCSVNSIAPAIAATVLLVAEVIGIINWVIWTSKGKKVQRPPGRVPKRTTDPPPRGPQKTGRFLSC